MSSDGKSLLFSTGNSSASFSLLLSLHLNAFFVPLFYLCCRLDRLSLNVFHAIFCCSLLSFVSGSFASLKYMNLKLDRLNKIRCRQTVFIRLKYLNFSIFHIFRNFQTNQSMVQSRIRALPHDRTKVNSCLSARTFDGSKIIR